MDRFARQSGIIPPDAMARHRFCVVGVGAVGRQVAMQLAGAGAKRVLVIDFDKVEPVNVATQHYTADAIGKNKVDAVLEEMKRLDVEGDAEFTGSVGMWRPSHVHYNFNPTVLFSCVDTMEGRRSIYHYFKHHSQVELYLDGRMRGENIRFFSVQRTDLNNHIKSYYDDTLDFTDEQAEQGRCTSESTYYASSLLSSLLIRNLSFHLRGFPIDEKTRQLNLLDLDSGFLKPRKVTA